MGVMIDWKKCIGCKKCVMICPGNILRQNQEGKIILKKPSGCWSCASCIKECPFGAISLTLSPSMGGNGGHMIATSDYESTTWVIKKGNGETKCLVTHTDIANDY